MSINLVDIVRHFSDEDEARAFLERTRWPNGVACIHCGSVKVYRLEAKETSKHPVRKGVFKCGDCDGQFTVTIGTIFEDSHIPLHKWLLAIHLMCSSKKGMSALQLQRMLDLKSYKSAWFMAHRIRYAMSKPPLVDKLHGIVEADETYVGGQAKNRHANKRSGKRGRGAEGKTPVVAVLERGGDVRAFSVPTVTAANLKDILRGNVAKEAKVMTDSLNLYQGLDKEFADHQTVDHSTGEYVRGDAHVNTAEGFFSLFKRGIVGSFHHVSVEHLDRYLDEFSFRWDARKIEDGERTVLAIKGAEGKRLMFKEPVSK